MLENGVKVKPVGSTEEAFTVSVKMSSTIRVLDPGSRWRLNCISSGGTKSLVKFVAGIEKLFGIASTGFPAMSSMAP